MVACSVCAVRCLLFVVCGLYVVVPCVLFDVRCLVLVVCCLVFVVCGVCLFVV